MLCYIYNSSIDEVNWLWLLSIFVGLWIWVVPATMTDECTDGYLWSVFQTLTDNFTDGMHSSLCHTITDGINPSAYFKRETFFWRAISICKTISKYFFIFPTNIATNSGITDEKKVDGHILSVRTSINKLLTKS